MNTAERTRAVPTVPLGNRQIKAGLPKVLKESAGLVAMTDSSKASVLFDMAAIKFGQTNVWMAAHLRSKGYRVSEQLVSQWRSVDRDELPHLGHLMALGEGFLRLLHKVESDHFGWGKRALLDVLNAIGEIAEGLEQ